MIKAARTILALLVLSVARISSVGAQPEPKPASIVVHLDRPGHAIPSTLYGLMTEEINHSYDGGLYAEQVQNRSFQDNPLAPVHWSLVQRGGARGSLALDHSSALSRAIPLSLRVNLSRESPGGSVGVANDGYWGIAVHPRTSYQFSCYLKSGPGFRAKLSVSLESSDGRRTYGRAPLAAPGSTWKRVSAALRTDGLAAPTVGRLVISGRGTGTFSLQLVSLFPPTYHNRANGRRTDLMSLLGAMKPSFLRFPGGNYLEGDRLEERFDWKKTVGPLIDRPGHRSPWGYRSTDGMGLLEFLEWCEDLKMEPLLAVFAGYTLNGHAVPAGPALDPFVQDANDEIDYVTAKKSTQWGARRAADGHPAPFRLRFVEIGNEDTFDRSGSYDGRFARFYDAIKRHHPGLQVIATAPVRSRRPDLIDDHYYRSAREMELDAGHYDHYPRTGPGIFVGEWASTEGSPTPTMNAALGDAAWMTGMERNSDLIRLSCYAPLLVNVNRGAAQWGTNLIGYDALRSFGSPSYWAQLMFARNSGDRTTPTEITQPSVPALQPPATGGIGVGTWRTQAEYRDLKVEHDGEVLYASADDPRYQNWRRMRGAWSIHDGELVQSSDDVNCTAVAARTDWSDYTYTLKARKTAGREGFLILFRARDRDNYTWWNLGGWDNTRSAVQQGIEGSHRDLGRPAPVTIETGRWYDIRIHVAGHRFQCYLDGKLITDVVEEPLSAPDALYATASLDRRSGDVILKTVNVSSSSVDASIQLAGARFASSHGTLEVLSGPPGAVNSLADPERLSPHRKKLPTGRAFRCRLDPHSINVIRLRARR